MSRRLAILAGRSVTRVALCLAFGSVSYALAANQFVSGDGQVSACVRTRTGKLRLVTQAKPCRQGEERVAWSQQGPGGTPGTPGLQGSIEGAPAGGDLTGTFPEPTIAPASLPVAVAANPEAPADPCGVSAPPTMVLCGTATRHWMNGGFGVPGLEVWRDRLGNVHIRGSATLSSGTALGALFVLPADHRPTRLLAFPIATGLTAGAHAGGSSLLVVYPADFPGAAGVVAVYSPSTADHQVVHLGEVVFRIDA
jgi:hypothetical protein